MFRLAAVLFLTSFLVCCLSDQTFGVDARLDRLAQSLSGSWQVKGDCPASYSTDKTHKPLLVRFTFSNDGEVRRIIQERHRLAQVSIGRYSLAGDTIILTWSKPGLYRDTLGRVVNSRASLLVLPVDKLTRQYELRKPSIESPIGSAVEEIQDPYVRAHLQAKKTIRIKNWPEKSRTFF